MLVHARYKCFIEMRFFFKEIWLFPSLWVWKLTQVSELIEGSWLYFMIQVRRLLTWLRNFLLIQIKNKYSISFTSKKVKVLVAQSCLILCDPMDCSSPGFSVHGILQARILEWVAIPFSRGSSQPRDQTWSSSSQADSLTLSHQGRLLETPWLFSQHQRPVQVRLFW